MFALTQQHRYFLYRPACDLRKGFGGLSGLVRNELQRNPLSGEVYLFLNRRRDRLKLLLWDGDGFVLYYKRLEAGTFEYPAGTTTALTWQQLVLMLQGIQLRSVRHRHRFSLPQTG